MPKFPLFSDPHHHNYHQWPLWIYEVCLITCSRSHSQWWSQGVQIFPTTLILVIIFVAQTSSILKSFENSFLILHGIKWSDNRLKFTLHQMSYKFNFNAIWERERINGHVVYPPTTNITVFLSLWLYFLSQCAWKGDVTFRLLSHEGALWLSGMRNTGFKRLPWPGASWHCGPHITPRVDLDALFYRSLLCGSSPQI